MFRFSEEVRKEERAGAVTDTIGLEPSCVRGSWQGWEGCLPVHAGGKKREREEKSGNSRFHDKSLIPVLVSYDSSWA